MISFKQSTIPWSPFAVNVFLLILIPSCILKHNSGHLRPVSVLILAYFQSSVVIRLFVGFLNKWIVLNLNCFSRERSPVLWWPPMVLFDIRDILTTHEYWAKRTNEWVNEWMNGRTDKQTDGWTDERRSEGTKERTTERTNKRTDGFGRMNRSTDERSKVRTDEWMNEWI